MKKILISFLMIASIAACNSNSGNSSAGKKDSTVASPGNGMTADEQKGLDLVTKSDCLTCHKISEASIGPSYQSVATKYKDAPSSIVDTLASKIIKGGSGNWGVTAMTPHQTVTPDEAKTMVKYVLSLKP